jgi:gliding motility-associated protein GldM
MGHGKETPRQKMIGMMYLVLMAMLALNVSNEVLNAFDVLDEGLRTTMNTLDQTNKNLLSKAENENTVNPQKAGPWFNKARHVKERADELIKYIQDLKIEILKAAKEDINEIVDKETGEIDARLIEGRDDTDAPAQIMIGDNNNAAGKELRLDIEDFRTFLVDSIVEDEVTKQYILDALNTKPDKGHEEGGKKTELHSWESQHFEHLPLSGVLAIMSGLQIHIRNAESEALKYLNSKIGAGEISFNKLEATVIPNSNYIIKGNDYSAQVFLAASDTTADPEIWVTTNKHAYDSIILEDGSKEYKRRDDIEYTRLDVPRGSGKGIFKGATGSLGFQRWGGVIEMEGPSGRIVKPFKQGYMVAEGSFSVAATKMNVFYLGVDNPVAVSVAGVPSDKISISVTNARHRPKGKGYIINPVRPGNAFVTVYANIDGEKRLMGRSEFRVRTVPTPVAMVNRQKGGTIKKAVLLAQIGVVAEMENFEFDLKFTITEFTVSATDPRGFTREYTSTSYRFTQEQMNFIRTLNTGRNLYIQDIKAVGPDGSTRPLSTINFKLIE